MEKAHAIVLITCVISILSGILDALKPDNRFDRQLRLLLSSVFVLAVLTPFAGGMRDLHIDWNSDVSASSSLADAVTIQTEDVAGENLETALTSLLTNSGVTPVDVTVVMHTNADGSIDIEQVTAFCSDADTANRLLTECLGEEVKIDVETIS